MTSFGTAPAFLCQTKEPTSDYISNNKDLEGRRKTHDCSPSSYNISVPFYEIQAEKPQKVRRKLVDIKK